MAGVLLAEPSVDRPEVVELREVVEVAAEAAVLGRGYVHPNCSGSSAACS